MDVGKERAHDCKDAGGRATQEQLPRSGSFSGNRSAGNTSPALTRGQAYSGLRRDVYCLVPTGSVGTQSRRAALRVVVKGLKYQTLQVQDAARPIRHSHAARGNERNLNYFVYGREI
jgi:hypothetical protein